MILETWTTSSTTCGPRISRNWSTMRWRSEALGLASFATPPGAHRGEGTNNNVANCCRDGQHEIRNNVNHKQHKQIQHQHQISITVWPTCSASLCETSKPCSSEIDTDVNMRPASWGWGVNQIISTRCSLFVEAATKCFSNDLNKVLFQRQSTTVSQMVRFDDTRQTLN